ncbi:MAG: glycosyl hydrolase family 28-related protein, partial [Pseudomonadales bacterium]
MTVNNTNSSREDIDGDGVTVAFTVNFKFLENTHLEVIHVDFIGAETPWVLDTDYTVTGAGNPTGTVTATTAPITGERLVIVRNVPFTQTKDYVANDPFPAESHENGLDKNTMMAQQLEEENNRILKVSVGTDPSVDVTLPPPVADAVIAIWSPTANAMVIGPTAGAISGAEASAQAAAASAVEAAASAATVTTEFANIATMVASTVHSVGDVVKTLGYITEGDGGNNLYKIVAAATGTVDGGSFIDLTGITGQAQGLFTDGLNVKQFGALGDDSTDDSATIQAALDYAYEDNAPDTGVDDWYSTATRIVKFPVGIYVMGDV